MLKLALFFLSGAYALVGVCILPTFAAPTPATKQATPLVLVQNHQSPYTIALAADAIPAEKTAATQLQQYLQRVTGARLPIQVESALKADAPQILVGAGPRVRALLPSQNWDALGSDGIVLKTVGNRLILAGGRPRGTLYAVFQFLEDVVGCRWWTPTESTVPQKGTLAIAPQNVVYVPPFAYREHFTNEVRYDPTFATIERENGHHQTQTADWGGHYSMLGFVHTFSELLPPEKYFKAHPEWFTDPANGNLPCTAASAMPGAQDTQLDLSNPQVLDELTTQALACIAQHPEAGYISISQNDNENYCTCPACSRLTAAEGTPAAPIIQFVNAVANRIGKAYPHFLVETLAYEYSLTPPKTLRPASNVLIRLAMNTTDFGHPIDSDFNAKNRDNLLAWAKIADNLFVWTYLANFQKTMFPHPTWAGLDRDARFFAAHKVKGVFAQGDCYTNGVGDFVQLRAWLMGKLLWDPNLNQDQLINEFLAGYYGAAAPHLRAYLDLIERAFLAQNRGIDTGNADFSFVTLAVANEALTRFQRAANAVKDDKVLADRVRRERLSLDVVLLYRYKFLQQEAQRSGQAFLGPTDLTQAAAEFKQVAHRFGVERFGENVDFETGVDKIVQASAPASAPAVPLPEFLAPYPAADVIDIHAPQMTLYQKGVLTDIVNDPAASDGIAAMMTGGTLAWSIQAKFGPLLEAPNLDWHLYVYARVDAKPDTTWDANAFDGGLYDDSNQQRVASFDFPWKDAAGPHYHLFDLGVHKLTGGMFLYLAPKNIPQVEKIYVDRILLVRQR